MKTKTFDCVEMKRKAQEKMRAKMAGFTPEEELAYFREGSEEFQRRIEKAWQAAQARAKQSPNA